MRFLQRHNISYHCLSTTDQNKIEEEILELVKDTDFLVLARYMQVFHILVLACFLLFNQMVRNLESFLSWMVSF